MFESTVDAAGALDALAAVRRARIELEDRELVLVGLFADCCPPPEHGVQRFHGSTGTPAVEEFTAAELGPVLATTTSAAATLIGDVLDLRHRLPRLWARVLAGDVPAWKVRAVAKATRELSVEAAGAVDAAVRTTVQTQPWPRFQTTLDAAVISADPVGAGQRHAAWAADRFVRTGRTSGHGYKLLVARAAAGDVIWFDAMITRIADILAVRGDPDPAQVRRSRALGVLAQPALALELLTAHRHDQPDLDLSPEPDETDDLQPGHAAPGDSEVVADPTGPADRGASVRLAGPGEAARIDPRAAAPTVVLHVHLSRDALGTGVGVAHLEGSGPVTVDEIRRFLGTRNVRITVRPVFDPVAVAAVDGYRIPARTAAAVRLRHPVEVFPYGTQPARTPYGTADLDHTVAYLAPERGGPPGQTGPANLAPLSRHHHRAKTHGGWSVRQPDAGLFVWRSRHGQVYVVTPVGTVHLGRGSCGDALWAAVGGRGAGGGGARSVRPASVVESALRARLAYELGA